MTPSGKMQLEKAAVQRAAPGARLLLGEEQPSGTATAGGIPKPPHEGLWVSGTTRRGGSEMPPAPLCSPQGSARTRGCSRNWKAKELIAPFHPQAGDGHPDSKTHLGEQLEEMRAGSQFPRMPGDPNCFPPAAETTLITTAAVYNP